PPNHPQEMAATQQAALDKAGTQLPPTPKGPATAEPPAPARSAPEAAPKAVPKAAPKAAPAPKTLDFSNDDPASDGSAATP
ncbi:MAG TPA: hypothetical protein VIV11_41155, partial [Kofleriaceae bacterium]